MNKVFGAWTLVFLLSPGVTGCVSSKPLVMRSTYAQAQHSGVRNIQERPLKTRTASGVDNGPCVARVASISDARTDPSLLGFVANRPVRSPGEGEQWMSGLLSGGLASKGVQLLIDDGSSSPQIGLAEVRLLSASVRSISTSMSGNVVIGVRDKPEAELRIYRGTSTGLNWSSGDGEIQALFDNAFEQVVVKLSADLKKSCIKS